MVVKAKSYGGLDNKGETLSEHTIKCLSIGKILLKNLPFNNDLLSRLEKDLLLALATHDVGKAAVGFQKSLEIDGKRWGHRHEILSAAFASSLNLSEEIILSVITHHKTLPSNGLDLDIRGTLPHEEIPWHQDETPIWKNLNKEWHQNISSFQEEWRKIVKFLDMDELSFDELSLKPLSIHKAWLSRNQQTKKISFEKRLYASILRGLVITTDHMASNSNVDINNIPIFVPQLRKYNLTSNMVLREFQINCGNFFGNLILRAPTGSGKTEAALLWAQNNQRQNGRLFYVLPNIASINAMYLRLKSLFMEKVGLLHSRTASSIYTLREKDEQISKLENQRYSYTISSLAREMWFPIRVCTPHQILRYSLQGKGWELMLSEFPNSCFIFDEIHAYEPRIMGLIIATVKFLETQNAKCLFLSATLPMFIRNLIEKEINNIEFIEPSNSFETDKDILNKKRHNIEFVDGDILSKIDFVRTKIDDCNSNLLVCNTIKSSQQVYLYLREYYKDILLLHSQFSRKDRNCVEKKIREKLPKVLIATQTVEVSLDLDFEQGFSEPAPLDALVQRFGRVNRRGDRSPAMIWIFTQTISRNNIYPKSFVTQSIKELELLKNPIRENDLVLAADKVYELGYQGEDKTTYELALNYPGIRNFSDSLIAGTHTKWIDAIIDELDGSIDLLPITLYDNYSNLENQGLWIESKNLLVPVNKKNFLKFIEYVDKKTDPWIIHMPYSEELGIYLDQDKKLDETSNII